MSATVLKVVLSVGLNSAVPGLGCVVDLYDAYQEYKDGEYLGMTLSLVSAAMGLSEVRKWAMAKEAAKNAGKEVLIKGAKETTKTTGKEALFKGAKETTKTTGNEALIKGAKETARTTGKETVIKGAKETAKITGKEALNKGAKETVKTTGKEAVFKGINETAKQQKKEIFQGTGKRLLKREAKKQMANGISKASTTTICKDLGKAVNVKMKIQTTTVELTRYL